MRSFDYLPEDSQINPLLMRALAVLVLGGCLDMIGTTVAAAIVVDDKSWLADTISDLAAGRWEEIQDSGIYALILATAAAAAGAANLHPGRTCWTLGILALVISVPCMVVIAAREAYSPQEAGFEVHIYSVGVMGLMLTAGPVLMSAGAARIAPSWRTVFLISGLGFGALIPVFFWLVPTSLDGLIERLMGLLAILWIGGLGVMFWNAANAISQRFGTGTGPRR